MMPLTANFVPFIFFMLGRD